MNRRHAFTLIEVLLALALILILLGAMLGFLWELVDRRNTLMRGGRDIQSANAMIERIEADLLAGLAGDSGVGAGVQGTATSLRLLSRGVWLASDPVGQAGGAGAGSVSALAAADLQGTEYVFNEGSLRLQARRFTYAGVSPAPSSFEMVSDRFERVRFRYFDGKVWLSSFDTMQQQKLPVAIEVAVWFTSLANETAPPPLIRPAPATGASQATDGAEGSAAGGADPATSLDVAEEKIWGQPDRLRVIIVPDGPQASWSEGT